MRLAGTRAKRGTGRSTSSDDVLMGAPASAACADSRRADLPHPQGAGELCGALHAPPRDAASAHAAHMAVLGLSAPWKHHCSSVRAAADSGGAQQRASRIVVEPRSHRRAVAS